MIDIVLKEGYTVSNGGDTMRDVKTTAELWGISTTRVTRLCRDGKIAGAVKEGKSWLIPEDAVKPADGRRKGSHEEGEKRLPLPIGISEYRLASTQYYYIDKTMLIKDFLDERPMVSLYTRPRPFRENPGIWTCCGLFLRRQGKILLSTLRTE